MFDPTISHQQHSIVRSEEHVEMVKQLVQARIDSEATQNELIRYKTM